jgi:hypothetical protein
MKSSTNPFGRFVLPVLTATICLSALPVSAGPTSTTIPEVSTATSCTACEAPRVQLAQRVPRGTPTQAGPAVQIPNGAMLADDTGNMSLCCPPSFANGSLGSFDRMPTGTGSGSDRYGIRFTPAAGLDAAMLGFAPFASQYVPAGFVGNSIHLKAELRHFNPVPWTVTTLPTSANWGAATPVKSYSMRAWWLPVSGTLAPSGIWNTPLFPDPNATNPAYQWERSFEIGAPASIAPHMQPNQWYMVKLSFQIAMKEVGKPDSWVVRDIDCNNMRPKYYRIKFDYSPNAKTTGAPNVIVQELAQ